MALVWGLALAMAACAVAPPATEPAPAASAVAASSGAALRVLVFRGGRARNLGHNHVAEAGDLRVTPGTAGPELRFRLDQLLLDSPATRAALGAGFESKPDAAAIAGTRTNLLRSLEAEAHPEVRVSSLQQVGEGAHRAVEIEISLHGQTRRQWITVRVDGRRARGEAVIRQSDFGITPFSVLGGLLAVQDALVVQFELEAAD